MIPLSKINTDPITNLNNKDKFKDDEIERFESMYPGSRIIRDNYETERQLDDDWNKYWQTPYSIRVLANDRAITLFGRRNEEQYKIQKAKFLKKDIDNHNYADYVPANESREVDGSSMARNYMNDGGYPLVTMDCESIKELNNQWRRYLEQGEDKKAKSNSQSIAFFGIPVEQVYQHAIKKFLKDDINNGDEEIDDMVIGENYLLIEDRLERLILAEKANLPVMVASCLNEYQDREPIGRTYINMTPWEVEDTLGRLVCEHSGVFANLHAKFLGIKPERQLMEDVEKLLLKRDEVDDTTLLEYGYNPNSTAHWARVNDIIKENMNYQFINLSDTPDSEMDNLNTGIAVMIINELDKDNREAVRDLPKVLLTTAFDSPLWQSLVYGSTGYTINVVDHITKFNKPSVSIFFLPIPADRLPSQLGLFASNEIERVTYALSRGCPDICNKHLFVSNLLNSILYQPEHDNDITLTLNRHIDGSKDTVLQVLDHVGNRISYTRIRKALNKVNLVKECVDAVPSVAQYFTEAMTYPTYPSEELDIPRADNYTWAQYRSRYDG